MGTEGKYSLERNVLQAFFKSTLRNLLGPPPPIIFLQPEPEHLYMSSRGEISKRPDSTCLKNCHPHSLRSTRPPENSSLLCCDWRHRLEHSPLATNLGH